MSMPSYRRRRPQARWAIIPPCGAAARLKGETWVSDRAIAVNAVRSLLTRHDGSPVPVVGTCGYGVWREGGAA